MAHLEVEIHDKTMVIRSQAFCCNFPDVGKNKKAVLVFLRALCSPETGKALFTYQRLADAFGYAARQNVENFVAEFHARGKNFAQFLFRANRKQDRLFPLVEAQILRSPFLSIHQHYLAFCEEHAEEKLSESTFNKYVKTIASIKILRRVRQLVSKEAGGLNVSRYLKELLEMPTLSAAKKKEIVEVFPDVKEEKQRPSIKKAVEVSPLPAQKKLLVGLLYLCNVSQDMLSLLFGVSKTSLHNWIYAVCSEELEWQILRAIVCWSGRVRVDEKWRWIDGRWHFALCAVDSLTGFPLLMNVYPTLDSVNWPLFLTRFKALYGVPKLIISEGSQSLAIARELVFKGVRYQLCKFHKLKNLMKRLRQYIHNPKRFRRCVRFAKHMFSNTSVSSRKHAAKTLQKLAGKQVASYIDGHILTYWRKLTMSLTNNASERFNRKIEKCFSGRYGIPSPESAEVLLRGLWLKELLLNGHKHLDATSELTSIEVSRICQEHLDASKILYFFHDNDPSHIDKVA
jgi:transposase-like protein